MKTVLLVQSSLRSFFFNYGKYLKKYKFVKTVSNVNGIPKVQHDFYSETSRKKSIGINRIRRLIGLLNLRPYLTTQGDLIFTYGCMLFTNKPYCICIENGLSLFNYDPVIAKNPIARLLFSIMILDSRLKHLIFISQSAKESFFSSINVPEYIHKAARSKSSVCYPITGRQDQRLIHRGKSGIINFIFSGSFYMKGGVEIMKTVIRLNAKYASKFTMTIVTQINLIKPSDMKLISSIPNIKLLNATLSTDQMNDLYMRSDVFVYPTYRDSFGLVMLEALSWGLPIICNNHFATSEMVRNNITGFVNQNHPLKDYDPVTYKFRGKYYDPALFYKELFSLQSKNLLRPIEEFLYKSMKRMITNPKLVRRMRNASLDFYHKKFDYLLSSQKIESIFDKAIS